MIKLRADQLQCDFERGTKYSGRDELMHDAAVAHALVKAIKDVLGPIAEPLFDEVHDRAAEILRDEFGIDP